MNIDGHELRQISIDGATDIEITTGVTQDNLSKIARGSFDVLVRGNRITISRAKRFVWGGPLESSERAAAIAGVREALREIRDPVAKIIP